MKHSLLIPVLLTALFASCAGAPHVKPIDNALLVEASDSGRIAVDEARTNRDRSADALAAAQAATKKAKGAIGLSEASLSTARSQLKEAEAVVKLAQTGSPAELVQAQAGCIYAEARVAYAKGALDCKVEEYDLAECQEELAEQKLQASESTVELEKAKALRDVHLIATKDISLVAHENRVAYFGIEVDKAASKVRSAQERRDQAEMALVKLKETLDATPH